MASWPRNSRAKPLSRAQIASKILPGTPISLSIRASVSRYCAASSLPRAVEAWNAASRKYCDGRLHEFRLLRLLLGLARNGEIGK